MVVAAPGTSAEPLHRPTVEATEWSLFTERFLADDGRVIDREKGLSSHSEGQGYGMLLAVAANDRDAFDRMHAFAVREMDGRADHLVSWLWDPHRSPRIADPNNASDGDILIAYALVRAALAWGEPRYLVAADAMIDDIGRLLVGRHGGRIILRPAAFGFEEGQHEDGPVVNLSYWVYGAFPLFEVVRPEYPWRELVRDGLALKEAARANGPGLAPDWITLRADRRYQPARGHRPWSSYDAIRIPLYMLMSGGEVPARHLAPFDRAWNLRGNGTPLAFDLSRGMADHEMRDPGYRAIAALVACAVRGEPLPASLQRFRPTTYFASTLHLLALSTARENFPACVAPVGTILAANGAQPGAAR